MYLFRVYMHRVDPVDSSDDHIEENMLLPRDIHLTCVSMATVGNREGLGRNPVGVGRDHFRKSASRQGFFVRW